MKIYTIKTNKVIPIKIKDITKDDLQDLEKAFSKKPQKNKKTKDKTYV